MDFDNDFYDDIHFRQYRIIEQDYEANAFFRNLHFAFTILMVHLIAFYLGFYIVGNYIYPHDFSWIRMDTVECNEIKEKPFEEKYLDKLKDMEETELTEEKLAAMEKCVLIEHTPAGNVIMLYNAHDESFWYFCDDKLISYKYLETVLRHYVIVYDCKSLYKNKGEQLKRMKEEQEKMAEEKERMKEEQEKMAEEDNALKNEENNDEENNDKEKDTLPEKPVTTTSVFARFKKSRIKSNKKVDKNDDKNDKNDKNDMENMEHLVQANRFSYKGNINNYQMIKKQLDSNLPKLDFKTFMKMQEEKKNKNKQD
jgi:hypothetical protein